MPKIFTEEDRAFLKTKLLQCGIEKLEHRSYKSISIDEIAAEVGIAKGTFYHFFPSKEIFFYEVMQFIKEMNREPLKKLFDKADVSKADISDCLFKKYTERKTVYDYFTGEEIKQIVRRIPDGDSRNDSEEFALSLCEAVNCGESGASPEVIVSLCNILGSGTANKSLLTPEAYQKAVRVLCDAIAAYICEGR